MYEIAQNIRYCEKPERESNNSFSKSRRTTIIEPRVKKFKHITNHLEEIF